jgi:hypothetical protein
MKNLSIVLTLIILLSCNDGEVKYGKRVKDFKAVKISFPKGKHPGSNKFFKDSIKDSKGTSSCNSKANKRAVNPDMGLITSSLDVRADSLTILIVWKRIHQVAGSCNKGFFYKKSQ